jgi:hypothetical protein
VKMIGLRICLPMNAIVAGCDVEQPTFRIDLRYFVWSRWIGGMGQPCPAAACDNRRNKPEECPAARRPLEVSGRLDIRLTTCCRTGDSC